MTKSQQKDLYIPIGIALAGIIIGLSVFVARGIEASNSLGQIGANLNQGGSLVEKTGIEVAIKDTDPVLGDDSAPVTMVEFGDFECPFCKRFTQETLPQIVKDYIDTGKVKIVWKDFPLSIHAYAELAHQAARCAGEQGQFWEYHDVLYENQQALDREDLQGYAADLDLNALQFNNCLDSEKYKALIDEGVSEGVKVGVRGTPAFVINGRLVVGALPYTSFKQVIDEALEE